MRAQNFDSLLYRYGDNLQLFYSGADLTGAALNIDIQIGMAVASWAYTSLVNTPRLSSAT